MRINVSLSIAVLVGGAYFLMVSIYALVGTNQVPQLVELITLLCFIVIVPAVWRLFTQGNRRAQIFFGFLFVYALILLLSTLFYGNPYTSKGSSFFIDVFLDSKFYVISLILLFFVQPPRLEGLFKIILGFLFIIACLNTIFIVHDLVSGRSIHGFPLRSRAGIHVPLGMFDHKLKSAQFQFLGVVSSVYFYLGATRRTRHLFLSASICFSFTVLLHLSAKEISALVLTIAAYFVLRNRTNIGIWFIRGAIVALFIAPVFIFDNPVRSAFSDRFSVFLGDDSSKTVRTAAYIGSVSLASEKFPLGTGAATFMSKGARDFYSPYYYQTKIAYSFGGSEENPAFLMDTYWPKITAQSGFIGLFSYLFATACSILWALRDFASARNGQSFAVMGILLSLGIYSLATPSYTHDHASIPFAVALALLLASKRKSQGNLHAH